MYLSIRKNNYTFAPQFENVDNEKSFIRIFYPIIGFEKRIL